MLHLEMKRLHSDLLDHQRNYVYYKNFFRTEDGSKAVEMAERRYRAHTKTTAGLTLKMCMYQNKLQRNLIEQSFRELKKRTKTTMVAHSEHRQAERLIMQEELNRVRVRVEDALIENGIEILSSSTNRYFRTNNQLALRIRLKTDKGSFMYTEIKEFAENLRFTGNFKEEVELNHGHLRPVSLEMVIKWLKNNVIKYKEDKVSL